LPEDGGGALWRAVDVSKGFVARESESLGLFLLPNGRPGHHFTGAEEEETTMADSLGLFLLLRGRPDARFSTMTLVSIDNASITHGELLIDW
jgi:hypothetical protein